MNKRVKKTISWISIIICGVILLPLLLGLIFFPRPDLPPLVNEDYCGRYNIRLDGTSIEAIFLAPETILASPDKFLQEDPAYRLLAESRVKVADPFRFEAWVKNIERLASQPEEKRKQHLPFSLYELIMAHQQSFCREVGPHVLAYLPEGTDIGATIYLTAMDEPVPGVARQGEIAFSLSHPLFAYAAMIHEPTGLSALFNLALHELFHIGFSDNFKPLSLEEHMENEVVIDMLIILQNEGMATYISHQLNAQYPSPFEWFLYLVDVESVVRLYIKDMNKLFAIAQTKPTGEAYDDIYRRIGSLCIQKKGFYIVGAYMAKTIEAELGREALIQTIVDGYQAFPETYNAIADEDMQIQWSTSP